MSRAAAGRKFRNLGHNELAQIGISFSLLASNPRYRIESSTFVLRLKKIKVRQCPLNDPTSKECRQKLGQNEVILVTRRTLPWV
jgi:hypothetical protein